jgi:hypothetical protein
MISELLILHRLLLMWVSPSNVKYSTRRDFMARDDAIAFWIICVEMGCFLRGITSRPDHYYRHNEA